MTLHVLLDTSSRPKVGSQWVKPLSRMEQRKPDGSFGHLFPPATFHELLLQEALLGKKKGSQSSPACWLPYLLLTLAGLALVWSWGWELAWW